MAYGQKTGGRALGTPNQVKGNVKELIAKRYPDYNPLLALVEIALDKANDVTIRLQANKEVAKYICPQFKAVEIRSSEAHRPVIINWGDEDNSRQSKKA